ncbi:hypothetical protein FKW77_005960 [Venturia effusa]|uniref:FAD-binding domain-containing protein n=1 Tax=Venturia effusa TaxID=50376 RepID=A0A517KWH8_9PEZI|nr:hypothetical protein FKW77_005960 [Venturia effusa]
MMPSLDADTNAWISVSNGAVQAPQAVYANGFVSGRMNGTHAQKGTNGLHAMNGRIHQTSGQEFDEAPVLIVGGGPTGLLLSYLLSKLNVKSLLIEKYPQRLAAPKAHALSPRTLEICRQFGLDTKKLRQLGTPRADAYWVNFVTSLTGEQIGVLPYERMDAAVLDDTPEGPPKMIHNIPQPDFEQFVADELANDSNVEIRKGVAFVSVAQNKDEVFSKVEERATGRQYVIRSQHLIACDGGRSAIAAVHQGWGGEKILDTYEGERRHLANVNSIQSVKNGKKIFSFLKALGTAGLGDLDESRQRLIEIIHDPSKKELIKNHIEAQREHFDNLELHIGYVYGDKLVPPNASAYTPKFVPGARVPHAWIRIRSSNFFGEHVPVDISYVEELSPEFVAARQYSVLDLCPIDSFTMLVGSQGAWMERFRKLKRALGQRGVKLVMFAAGEDFEFTNEAHLELFANGAGLKSGSGLLLRPDQHILTRLASATTVEQMESDLLNHLSL